MTMASDREECQVDNNLDRLSIGSEDSLNRSNTGDVVIKENEESIQEWGFRLKDLYRLALRFYKGRHSCFKPNEVKCVFASKGCSLGPLTII
jgi:hypothetical protein